MKVTALIALALAAGCSGGEASTTAELRPAQLAERLGCASSYSDESTEELYVRELGSCTLAGETANLYTFKDNTARDDWIKIASQFGGRYEVIDRALVSGSGAVVDAAHDMLGGTVK